MKLNIRTRMIILVLIAILPSIVLIFYLNSQDRKSRELIEINNLQSLAQLYSSEHSQIIDNTRHLLIALSATPQLYSTKQACDSYLGALLNKYQRYSNFGVTDKDGNVICSAVSSPQKINVSNTLFFKQTTKTQDFAVGEYRISQANGDAVLSFGYPITNGIVYSSVDLSWLNQLTQNISPDKSISTLVLDNNAIVLARNPDPSWVGKEFPQGALIKNLKSNSAGVVQDTGLDGVKRVYAYKQISDVSNSPFVIVGIEQSTIFAQSQNDFENRLILVITIAVISVAFTWWSGTKLIIKQVEALKQVDQLKDDFISLVSHQIRTPLTSINWFSEILLTNKKYKLTKLQKELVIDMREASKKVTALVGTLLSVSRFESGKIELNLEKTDLVQLTFDVIDEQNSLAKSKQIKINFKPTNKLIAKVDPKLIKQVYANLISNALKYSSDKSDVLITLRKQRKRILFQVKDNGIGIPDSQKNKVFQKFLRADNAIKTSPDGSGIGLYLSKLIVEAHGGQIWFKSKINRGSEFFVLI